MFGSYAKGFSAPRTDNLYRTPIVEVAPETTNTFDAGFRYSSRTVQAQASAWYTKFNNRIVTSFDQIQGISVDRNVGSVERIGAEGSIGWSPIEALSLYASATWLSSEVQDDYVNNTVLGVPQIVRTKGKELVETPEWMASARINYDFTAYLSAGIQATLGSQGSCTMWLRSGTEVSSSSLGAWPRPSSA